MQAAALLGTILLPKELTILSEQGHSKVDTLEIVETGKLIKQCCK